MELLSPATSQPDHTAASKPTPSPDAVSVAVETRLQSSDQDETAVEDFDRSPRAHAVLSEDTAPAAEQDQGEASLYEQSKFAPINAGEKDKPTPPASTEPADEIVVGSQGRKAAMGAKTSKTVGENSKVDVGDGGADDDVPGLRVSKRKRTSRYIPDPELEMLLDDLENGDEPLTTRPARPRKTARATTPKKAPETPLQNSAADPGNDGQLSFNNSTVTHPGKTSNRSMVPLDAPIRPARRGPNNNKQTKPNSQSNSQLNHQLHQSSTTMDMNGITSDSELSDPKTPANMDETTLNVANPAQEPEAQQPAAPLAALELEVADHAADLQDGEPVAADPVAADAQAADVQVVAKPDAPSDIRIVIGYWKGSSEANLADKHAIVGVLGSNKQLRTRLAKHTRDGRHVSGNYPHGAGGIWRGWHEIEFEPHIRQLTRAQLKEYIRVRQTQIAAGESPEDEADNETKAVEAALTIPRNGQERVCDFEEKFAKAGTPQPASKTPALKRKGLSTSMTSTKRVKHTPTVEQMEERSVHYTAKSAEIARRRSVPRGASTTASARIAATPADSDLEEDEDDFSGDTHPAAARDNLRHPHPRRIVDHPAMSNVQGMWEATHQVESRSNIPQVERRPNINSVTKYTATEYIRKQVGPLKGLLTDGGTPVEVDGEDYIEFRVLLGPAPGRR